MPKKKTHSKKPTEILKNSKGEIVTWDQNSKDGQTLKVLFATGVLTDETASQIKADYPQFRVYATKTLGSAIQNLRRSIKKEAEARKSKGSKGKFALLLLFAGRQIASVMSVVISSMILRESG